jgi:DNA-directed RNA polymerase subunit RPC12/RpoP
MNIPYWLLKQLPMWDYICRKCKRDVKQKSHKCPYCGENYGVPLRVPPKVLKDPKALEEYVHKHIFPKVSASQREYLTRFFTIIFQDGFESGDFSAWTGTSGTPTIVTSPVHHGSYAAQAGNNQYFYKNIAAYNELYYRFYINFSSLTADTHSDIAQINDISTPQRLVYATIKTYAGVIDFALLDAVASVFYDTGVAVSTGQWYCIEIAYLRAVSGFLKMWVDGTLKVDVSKDTSSQNQANNIRGGNQYIGGIGFVAVYDCVVVADTYIGPEVPPRPKGSIVVHAKLAGVI